MPKINFLPFGSVEAKEGAKILAVAIRNKIQIQYACSACQCGTCAVKILSGGQSLSRMEADEQSLLNKLGLSINGDVRLACRTKLSDQDIDVDLDFQKEYK